MSIELTCARTADANCKLGSNVSGTTYGVLKDI